MQRGKVFRWLPIVLVLVPVAAGPAATPSRLPWREAGWSERQAAAHLLDRFAFGARPSEVDRVVGMGLETWVDRQLAASFPEAELTGRLRPLSALSLTELELALTYPPPAQVLREATRQGIVEREALQAAAGESSDLPMGERRRLRAELREWARKQGYRPQRELLEQLVAAKIVRAVHAENQLREVMTDFWFNHFNVSATDNKSRGFLLGYERDAIRPFVLAEFRALLGAVARHPAMLLYLDNAQSRAAQDQPVTFEPPVAGLGRRAGRRGPGRPNQPTGLNENFARELLELHTLGVDGGYGQQDVVEVARAFTGWTVMPPQRVAQAEQRLRGSARAARAGFVMDGLFLFRADQHDAANKIVLGQALPAGRGIEDGEAVLDLLAHHPATARHLAKKLAVRFVADEPPATLVERLAARFLATRGDVAAVLRTLVESPEFWAPAVRRQKIKSPFELAVSAVRALGAETTSARALAQQIGRMGQPLYAYQAPTGFPDRADAWVNTGALLARMNFGLELAAGQVRGLRFDLEALTGGHEAESVDAALAAYLPLLLPEREVEAVARQLAPVVNDPALGSRLGEAARPAEPQGGMDEMGADDLLFPDLGLEEPLDHPGQAPRDTLLAQVVGVIIGSPEFQRR